MEYLKPTFPKSIASKYEIKFENGIATIYNLEKEEAKEKETKNEKEEVFRIHSFEEYMKDLKKVLDLAAFGPAKTMCYRRLKILESRYELHLRLNDWIEETELKAAKV